jgi:hypothetical protein
MILECGAGVCGVQLEVGTVTVGSFRFVRTSVTFPNEYTKRLPITVAAMQKFN